MTAPLPPHGYGVQVMDAPLLRREQAVARASEAANDRRSQAVEALRRHAQAGNRHGGEPVTLHGCAGSRRM